MIVPLLERPGRRICCDGAGCMHHIDGATTAAVRVDATVAGWAVRRNGKGRDLRPVHRLAAEGGGAA